MEHHHPGRGLTARLMPMAFAFVDIPGGVRLHYLEKGRGDLVVLLHGGVSDCCSWPSQMSTLSPHYRMLAYSRRYHFPNANASLVRNYSCRLDADDLGHFLDALDCRRLHLVGTSYGALTALQFALLRPHAVMSLVLIEPPMLAWLGQIGGGLQAREKFLRDVWQRAAGYFASGDSEEAMRCLYEGMRGRGRFDSLAGQRKLILRNALAMRMLTASSDAFPELALSASQKLEMPILLVTGQETVPLHRMCHEVCAKVLVNAREAVIPKAGHAPANENPADFNRALGLFLTRQHTHGGS